MITNDDNNNKDIDTLLNEVLQNDDKSLTPEQIDAEQIESPFEQAKKELFPDKPVSLSLEDVKADPAIYGVYPKAKKKSTDKVKVSDKTPATSDYAPFNTQQFAQEKIDIDANLTELPSEEALNKVNYKDVLGKIIKNNGGIDTKEFKMSLENEEGLFVSEDDQKKDKETKQPTPLVATEEKESHVFDIIAVRTYTPKTAIDDTINYIYINRLSIATFGILLLLNIIEILVMFFVMQNIVELPWVYYVLCGLVALLPLGVGIFRYGLNPNLKIRTKFNFISMFINAFIFMLVCAVLILSIAFLTATSLVEMSDFLPKILMPALFVLDAPIGVLIYLLLSKCNVFYVNKRIIKE